jgi:hypothetical protein
MNATSTFRAREHRYAAAFRSAHSRKKPLMTTFELTDARMAENQARFREANEQIEVAAERFEIEVTVPFLCECPDLECTAIVSLDLTEYEAMRSSPVRFFTTPEHATPREGYARLVRETERFAVLEKEGVAATIAAKRDPRKGA